MPRLKRPRSGSSIRRPPPALSRNCGLKSPSSKTWSVALRVRQSGTLNKSEEFYLAVCLVDGDRVGVRYVRQPFEKEPDFQATSVNYDLAALLAQAQEPA